jgi:hypothetical protein
MLELRLVSLNVVVLAESNNPRLLNPDFLERNEIVPKKWMWKPAQVLVLPPISNVTYENGVSIQVEETKLQFLVEDPKKVDWQNLLPVIITTYLDVLPHVSYKSVGLNYTFFADEPTGDEAEQLLVQKILKEGPWLRFGKGLTGAIVEFQYRASQPYLTLKAAVRQVTKEDKRVLESYVITANLHFDLAKDQTADRKAFINSLGSRYTEILDLAKQLPLGKS